MDEIKFRRRKLIYSICSCIIIISLIMIVLISIFNLHKGILFYGIFIFETTALWAFGAAWLVKGSLAKGNTRNKKSDKPSAVTGC